ncbi:MAG: hypothetical protein CSA58_07155 [Micrococcales bacterium]|nr:MAG: hypothetical protein CSB46_06640 [Micrococcales bacterium]PIE26873.1 MAG: hypothetical protein CSA58_07155 [Micrococcales bacterium]
MNNYERRQALQQRMARAANLEELLDSALQSAAFDGLALAQVDQDGALRNCARSIVIHVASQQPVDMVVHRGPGSPWGLRIIANPGGGLHIHPVRIGTSTETAAGTDHEEEVLFDGEKAAQLAAMMWQNR